MVEPVSPSTDLYHIGKANVYFTPKTGGTRRHLGNVPELTFQIETEKLDHFSSMAGIKKKDFSATVSSTATVTLSLEEISLENLRLALLGGSIGTDSSTEGDGLQGFEIGAVESFTGEIECIGSNDVGQKVTILLYEVTLTPSDAVSFIGEDYTVLSLTGDCLAKTVGGDTSFGKVLLQA